MPNIEKTACRYAWTYPIIDMGRGELRNCCRTPFNTIGSSDWAMGTDIFKNLEAIRKVKKELLLGIETEKCRTCWKSEEFGIQSPRSGLEDFAKFIKAVKWQHLELDQVKDKLNNLTDAEVDELVNLEHPEHVELSLSTTCDLKCVYCSHVFSTQWATERLKFGEITIEQVPKNSSDEYEKIWWRWFEETASKTVHKITFVGGEPLINEKFYYYLDRLIDYYENVRHTYIHIFVATNFNTPKKYLEKFFAAIRKITSSKYVSIGIGLSFESTGAKNDFIRSNADWESFSGNINKLIETIVGLEDKWHKSNIVIMPSINSLSISDLPNFLDFIIGMRDKFDRPIRLSNTHVTYPMRYSPFILTVDYVQYIDAAIERLKSSKWVEELPKHAGGSWTEFIDYLGTIKQSILNGGDGQITNARREFVADIDKLSTRRNLNFHQTFPEMVEFYKFCQAQ